MYLINGFFGLLRSAGTSLLNVVGSQEPEESTPLVEERQHQGGDYEAMAESNVTSSRASLSTGFRSFDQSSYAIKLCAAMVVLYIVMGMIAFSYIFEDWPLVSSAYFSVVTFTTVGYGDLSPTTQGGRLFSIFFVLFGVTILGCFLGIIGAHVVDAETSVLERVKLDSHDRILRMFSGVDNDNDHQDTSDIENEDGSKKPTLLMQIGNVVLLETPILLVLAIAVLAIGKQEGWTSIDSIYFGTISLSTVGFGDMHPESQSLQLVCILFLPIAVAVFGELLGRIASVYINRSARRFEAEFLARECTLSDLHAMDRNFDRSVSRAEFISFMLVAMQKVEQDDIDELDALFDSLDADGSGALDKADLVLLANRKKENPSQPDDTMSETVV